MDTHDLQHYLTKKYAWPEPKKTARSKTPCFKNSREEKQKRQYAELLMKLAEDLVRIHRLKIRHKQIDEIKLKCDLQVPYEFRNEYLEFKIENITRYLDIIGAQEPEFVSLRRQLIKIERFNKKRQQLKKDKE